MKVELFWRLDFICFTLCVSSFTPSYLSHKVTEEEAVDILARKYGVLLMPGSPFGAPQHMRLSYGGLPPAAALKAVQQLTDGFRHLNELSTSR